MFKSLSFFTLGLTMASLTIAPALAQSSYSPTKSQRQLAREETIAQLDHYIEADSLAPYLGAESADQVVVIFFDYQCGYCRLSYLGEQKLIEANPDVRITYKPYPILDWPGRFPASRVAAQVAVKVQQKGDFETYHKVLMERNGPLDEALIFSAARQAGLSNEDIADAPENAEIAAYIDETDVLATMLSINSTPSYVISNRVYRGHLSSEVMEKAVRLETE